MKTSKDSRTSVSGSVASRPLQRFLAWSSLALRPLPTLGPAIAASILLCTSFPSLSLAQSNSFEQVSESLVLITTARGTASGFVLSLGATNYLVSNEHVLRGGAPLTVRTLNNEKYTMVALELSVSSDLARMRLPPSSAKGLPLAARTPIIGESITVYGNSDGGGVATAISGKVVGVGPSLIEVDAPFVRGNSGSPILDSAGQVLGVVTFATRDEDPKDWLKRGTRFQQVRRFGTRLLGQTWKELPPRDYFVRANALSDIEQFSVSLYALLFTRDFHSSTTGRRAFNAQKEIQSYAQFGNLCQDLASVAVSLDTIEARLFEVQYLTEILKKARTGAPAINAQQQRVMAMMEGDKAIRGAEGQIDAVINSAATFIADKDWKIQRMEDDAVFWVDILRSIQQSRHRSLDRFGSVIWP
jgi:hypothetical protein